MSRFTKGQWGISSAGFVRSDSGNGRMIAAVYPCKEGVIDLHGEEQLVWLPGDEEMRDANTRLIAASPAMHDELSRIHVGTTITTEHFNRIQRLLDQIEGIEA